ncbi:MAG: HAMP domain-containing sensor histidine kinase [Oscillospiraceae bacterium]|nr:HAMP domain-containing sensor histidine kinase [Oscillospiraceae bacterium]
MNKLKIRTKMMLWYSVFSTLILAILLPVVYSTVSNSLYQSLESELQVAVSQMISSLEVDDGKLTVNTELDIEGGTAVCMTDASKKVIFSTRKGDWLADALNIGDKTIATHNEVQWLIVKQDYHTDGVELTLFAGSSTASVAHSLGSLRLLLLALVPLYLGLSALGAYFIARRTLKPISAITETACSIGEGDLSQRIDGISSKDEVGELALAFNTMLDKMEASFRRERQFSSDASHELRTPVAVISACVEDALNGKQSPETLENLMTIQKESNRMNRIISQLLTLTRGYEGRHYIEKERIMLRDMVDSVMDELSDFATDSNITLKNDVSSDIEICADQSLMTQLFVNVIGNGIKYGKSGGIVNIAATDYKTVTEIIVSDDGIGICEEDITHIFERFYRADKARDRTGTGLGLAIVKWIVDIHNGSISVSSKEGESAVFYILLSNEQ